MEMWGKRVRVILPSQISQQSPGGVLGGIWDTPYSQCGTGLMKAISEWFVQPEKF